MVWQEEKGNMEDIWTPTSINEEIVGKVVKVESTNFGKQFSIENRNGKVMKTPCHKALQNLMIKIQEGDMIKVVYVGEKASGKGNPTQLYKVYVDKPGVVSEVLSNIAKAQF